MPTPADHAPEKPWAARPGVTRDAVSPVLGIDVPPEVRRLTVPVLSGNRSPVLVEVDLTRDPDTEVTRTALLKLFTVTFPRHPKPVPVAASYLRCLLSPVDIQRLLDLDRAGKGKPTIFRVWPDYTLDAHIDRSVATIKADAVSRAYAATGRGIVWAVLDSGIDEHHPHFATGTLEGRVKPLHRDFTDLVARDQSAAPADSPLTDPVGHGTHVAGIIAGELPDDTQPLIGRTERQPDGLPHWTTRELNEDHTLAGIAPRAQLVSLKVLALDGENLITSSSAVIKALYYIRETVNTGGQLLVIHGANLSFGCTWDARDYACGQSPLCREVNLLSASGVVVVVSAGNDGFSNRTPNEGGAANRAVLASISDPGNAADAITVGSTHRDRPHEYGVTYSSSKGPTLDGRLKPDLLAPGERIASCATGEMRKAMAPVFPAKVDPSTITTYVEESGTSMAAPHVSGAIAAFLSVRQEFVGRPREIKELFCANATSLGRDRYLEGHGLLDLMRVMSNV